MAGGGRLLLQANLSAASVSGFSEAAGQVFWSEGQAEGVTLKPWAVRWSVSGN